jgi:predicted Fe-Mo cluster-binding NifX family protein
MKVAISSAGCDLSSAMDARFGRAKYFVVADTETNETEAHDNAQNLNAAQGAGIQTAQNVAALGVQAVVSGNVGPKAFRTLTAAGIKMYLCGEGSVAEALRRFRAGELKELTGASVEGHWS